MDFRDSLLTAARVYCGSRSISLSRLSTIITGGGKLLERLAAGKGCTLASYERVMQWLSDNWPDDVAWPEGIERPPANHDRELAPRTGSDG